MSYINRLISVQGPTQVINVISILKSIRSQFPDNVFHDYLVVGGMDTVNSSSKTKTLCIVISQIATLWDFAGCLYIDDNLLPLIDLDVEMNMPLLSINCLQKIKYQEIFACRNWQPFNIYILNNLSFDCVNFYGDGFGLLDPSRPLRSEGLLQIRHILQILCKTM